MWEANRPGPDRPRSPSTVELERVIPIIRAVRESSDIPISIDTTKSEVALRRLEAGADIINDMSSLRFDPDMARVAAESGAPVILMHMLGVPRTMQVNPVYESVISEIIAFLEERMKFAVQNGDRARSNNSRSRHRFWQNCHSQSQHNKGPRLLFVHGPPHIARPLRAKDLSVRSLAARR